MSGALRATDCEGEGASLGSGRGVGEAPRPGLDCAPQPKELRDSRAQTAEPPGLVSVMGIIPGDSTTG